MVTMQAGIHQSTNAMVSSTTSMPTPTPTNAGGESGSRVVAFPIIA